MKKIIVAVVMTALFTLPAIAQQQKAHHTPEEKATKMTEKMAENLDLTDDQKEAVYNANLEMARTMEEDRKAARKSREAQLKEILSEEQYAKVKEDRSNFRKKARHHHKEMRESREVELQESPKED